jgi:hypothetical protein
VPFEQYCVEVLFAAVQTVTLLDELPPPCPVPEDELPPALLLLSELELSPPCSSLEDEETAVPELELTSAELADALLCAIATLDELCPSPADELLNDWLSPPPLLLISETHFEPLQSFGLSYSAEVQDTTTSVKKQTP